MTDPEFYDLRVTHNPRTAKHHNLIRTSPKGLGQKFIGTCTLCGTPDLPSSAVHEECPNQRGLSEDDALVETLEILAPKGDTP